MNVVTVGFSQAWKYRCKHAARVGRRKMKRHANRVHRLAARAALRGDWLDVRERLPRRLTGWEVV